MQTAIREYDAKLDTKRRLTLRNANFDYYHVQEMDDGTIVLEPRELTVPFQISVNTLSMMDKAVENMKSGKVSEPIDLSMFELCAYNVAMGNGGPEIKAAADYITDDVNSDGLYNAFRYLGLI